MAYSALLTAARALDPDALGRYEPFLWGEPTWDKLPENFGQATLRTDSLNSRGIYAHTQSPLFLEDESPILGDFIEETLPSNRAVVLKDIRVAGRLSAFLKHDPDLRIVHLIRNPLDVVNSGLRFFSFYGNEFHPSDEPRFNVEAAALFGELHRPTDDNTETERTLEWWRLMNEAALRSARQFPDRIKIVAYEHLMSDIPGVMGEIVTFLGGTPDLIAADQLGRKVGPTADQLSLRKVDVETVLPHVEAYFSDKRIFDRKRQGAAISKWKDRLIEKYSTCKEGDAFERTISPSLAPTNVRTIANRSRLEAQAAQVAGEEQASLISKKLSASLEPLQHGVGNLKDTVAHLQETVDGFLNENSKQRSAEFAEAVAAILREVAEGRKIVEQQEQVNAALAAQLAEKKQEIEALTKTVSERGKYSENLSVQLKETQDRLAVVTKDTDRDIKAGHHLIARLRQRIAALREEHSNGAGAFEKMRRDYRNLADRLRNAENQLKLAKGELEQSRLQASEMASVLAPRFKSILTLKPLRYILLQRQRVKAGIAEVDRDGFVRLKITDGGE